MSVELSGESQKIINESDFYKMSRVCDKCHKSCDVYILGLCAECFKIADEKTVAGN